MKSEDAQESETAQLAQVPAGNVGFSNAKQDAEEEEAAWLWRIGRLCREWFFQSKCFCLCLLFGVLVSIIIVLLAVKPETSHDGKFLPEQCPSEWIGYKKKCYFVSEEEKDWTSSQTFCARNESLLAIFENQEEMHSLAKRLKIDDSWIGLRKKGESFYWENGVALQMDLFQIRNHSECAYLDTLTISTSACSLPRRWICIHFP
ncbi:C-type lectin domain family 2 member B-like [Opisthocomus hoazin]|uniref:C-type lectin domain family 2 member B-like n=1 Tax=Opisthocomus hoazin TaxID=30419 RepID=UPI003F5392AA